LFLTIKILTNGPTSSRKDALQSKPDLARFYRAKSGRILAALVSQCRDLQLAEDALHDAFLHAGENWPANIRKPDAWLLTIARRRLIDKLRQSSRHSNEKILSSIADSLNPDQVESEATHEIPDERLKLIFTCCHPALNQEAQVALTLKTLCGLSSREIARAYLTSETAMNQRLVRAKRKIREAGIAYRVPEKSELDERLAAVLSAIYLIYNESYSAFEGQTLTRNDLAEEAIRLASVLERLLPEPEVSGLLSLMLLHHSRNPARSDQDNRYIPLECQNRALWDAESASQGRSILIAALGKGQPGKYQLQAAISALHSEADDWNSTDWRQICLLYVKLYEHDPSPIVKLNGIVALAFSGKSKLAYRQLPSVAQELEHYQPFYAAKAEIEVHLGMLDLARESYQKAIDATKNSSEKGYLSAKLAKMR